MRCCTGCLVDKPTADFYPGYSKCRECLNARKRERHLERYGLSSAAYQEMLEQQEFLCAVCLEPAEEDEKLQVDHDHTTGVVRGLLCWRCNRALGFLRDDPDNVRRLLRYLAFQGAERQLHQLHTLLAELGTGAD